MTLIKTASGLFKVSHLLFSNKFHWTQCIVDLEISDRVTNWKSQTETKDYFFGKCLNVRGQNTFMQTTRATLDLTVTGSVGDIYTHIPFHKLTVSKSFDIWKEPWGQRGRTWTLLSNALDLSPHFLSGLSEAVNRKCTAKVCRRKYIFQKRDKVVPVKVSFKKWRRVSDSQRAGLNWWPMKSIHWPDKSTQSTALGRFCYAWRISLSVLQYSHRGVADTASLCWE